MPESAPQAGGRHRMRGQMSHPDSEVLAEYREGLISGRRAARITAHLAACDHCAVHSDQLAEISVRLASAPVPAMPEGVARRLDTALAAEAAQRNDAERAGAKASRDRAAHPRPTRGWRLVTVRVLAPAAAIVALAAVGFGLSRIGGPTSSSAASAAGSAPAPSAAARAFAPANAAESPGAATALGPSHTFKVYNSSTSYQRSTLRDQIEHELSTPAGPAAAPSAQIKGCVNRVTGPSGETPVLVENARFQGQPAIIIIASRDGSDTVWVTAPGCSAASDTVLDMQPGISAP